MKAGEKGNSRSLGYNLELRPTRYASRLDVDGGKRIETTKVSGSCTELIELPVVVTEKADNVGHI